MFPIRVIVADDHRLFRQGLISLLKTRADRVQVVGEASSGREAISMARQLRPQVILMDIYMPDGDGLQATRVIREELPEIAVIMLTSSEQDDHIYEAVRCGAAGYLLKNLDVEELFGLLAGVIQGEAAITRAVAARMLHGFSRHSSQSKNSKENLTEREIEVLKLVAMGKGNNQIAESLCITVNTVKSHLKNILSKLNLENRTQAATYALQNNILPQNNLLPQKDIH